MPTYEYACDSCNHQFEAMQSMSDEPLTECPQCSGKVRRMFGLSSVIFKGSGFYCTDTKKSDPGKESSCANCPGSNS
ncbi:MAG TPA: FmdB family zinc ribbon protein [Sphaerochaetaceae bacterium]|nr:FmdB family zinc ribbon protein [Sphaerochaetaceae bacterium]